LKHTEAITIHQDNQRRKQTEKFSECQDVTKENIFFFTF